MIEQQWTAVDRYITDLLVPPDPALDSALAASAAAGLPAINVSPNQGKLLMILAQLAGARRILEIGTLGGYSTIWLARAFRQAMSDGAAGGRLITLEADARHAEVARKNIQVAGLADIVELRLGPALQTLPRIAAEKQEPFDLFFIDADKQNNPEYFRWALMLSHPGSLIIIDNVVRSGAVIDAKNEDPAIKGTRELLDLLAREKRITATAIQTVGSKGYDGFAVARVN